MTTLCLNGAVRRCALVVAAIIALVFQCYARAVAQGTTPTVTILHSFDDGSVANDGEYPQASLMQAADGNFYGTTMGGGSTVSIDVPGYGTAFKITPSGTETVLHSFHDNTVAHDGESPFASLIQGADGNFYGTAAYGGSPGDDGAAFTITSSGTVTTLHSFGDVVNDGFYPSEGLVLGPDGDFYGTTLNGGSPAWSADPSGNGYGIVFKMSPSGTETILHSFDDGSVSNDGSYPSGCLVLGPDGDFYGTTLNGGSTGSSGGGSGAVFKVSPSGTVTILHSFGDGSVTNDGTNPEAGLVLGSDGNFYGTTYNGGSTAVPGVSSGYGTVFKITPSGTVTILHSFGDGSIASDGLRPYAGLIQGSDGNFYGTTLQGGSTVSASPSGHGDGTVFKMTLSGAITILHSFGDGSVIDDGEAPIAGLIQGSDGNLYGTTAAGGSTATETTTGAGTVFRLSDGLAPPAPAAPIGLTATAGSAQVTLSWVGCAGATSYNVYRGTSTGGESATAIGSSMAAATAYTDTGLLSGVTYFYTVAAVNPSGTSTTWGEASATPLAGVATTLKVSPGPTLTLGIPGVQQFSATVYDQFGNPMSPQPAVDWSLESGSVGSMGLSDGVYHTGQVPGTATIRAKADGLAATVAITVSPVPVTVAQPATAIPNLFTGFTAALSVLGAYAGEGGVSSLTYTWTETSGPSGVTFSVNGTNAANNTTATVKATGSYTFTVTIASPHSSTTSSASMTIVSSPKAVLITPRPLVTLAPLPEAQQFTATAYDQFGNAMSPQPAILWSLSPGSVGSLSTSGLYHSGKVAGFAVVNANTGPAGAAVQVEDDPPVTIATAASAIPSPVTGTTTTLSALGAYAGNGGAGSLAYTWAETSGPASASFSANGGNAAASTTATFTQAGIYDFTVTITSPIATSVTSSVSVSVNPMLTSITVSPGPALTLGPPLPKTQQFTATGLDQFGHALSTQPAIAWSVASGGVGSISVSGGLYHSGAVEGSATVKAKSGTVMGTSAVTVQ